MKGIGSFRDRGDGSGGECGLDGGAGGNGGGIGDGVAVDARYRVATAQCGCGGKDGYQLVDGVEAVAPTLDNGCAQGGKRLSA